MLEVAAPSEEALNDISVESPAINNDFILDRRDEVFWKVQIVRVLLPGEKLRIEPVAPMDLIAEFLTRSFIRQYTKASANPVLVFPKELRGIDSKIGHEVIRVFPEQACCRYDIPAPHLSKLGTSGAAVENCHDECSIVAVASHCIGGR